MTVRRPHWRLALVALWAATLFVGVAGQALALAQAQSRHADVVELDTIIHPISARFLAKALDQAAADGAEVVVVAINTPGGLLTSTREMVASIFASPVPVVVFVAPQGARAASAGTFITAAGHVAAMAPGTNIGAASPIGGQGEELGETLKNKIFEDTAAEIRSIAERRGRPVAPLEATVLEAKAYTASEALELGIIDLIADDVRALLAAVDGMTVAVAGPDGDREIVLRTADIERRDVRMGFFEQLLSFIADPNISFMLISLGGLGLFVEIMNPGLIFPGVFGVLALVLGFVALGNLPGNWAGVALILLAFALGVAEANVSGFGVLGVLGIVSFVFGGILLFGHFGTPDPSFPGIRVSLWVLVPTAAVMAGAGGTLVVAMVHSRRETARMPSFLLEGAEGVATTVLNPSGTVRVRGELWSARASGEGRIERGAGVVVRGEDGALLTVERAGGEAAGEGSETQQ
jgi:membrane-bound serine protease (ClpP class)